MKVIGKLVCSVSVCLMTGFLGSFTTMDSVSNRYADLSKPFFTPPDWAFGVIWPILYVIMCISAFMIWNKGIGGKHTRVALGLFILQLILNGLWTPIFFGLHIIALALAEIIISVIPVASCKKSPYSVHTVGKLCRCSERYPLALEQIRLPTSTLSHIVIFSSRARLSLLHLDFYNKN